MFCLKIQKTRFNVSDLNDLNWPQSTYICRNGRISSTTYNKKYIHLFTRYKPVISLISVDFG